MRENTLFLRRAESNAAMGQFSSFRNAIMTSPDLARIMGEGISNPGALSAPDLMRAMSAVDQMMWANYQSWMRERSGTTEPGEAWNAAMEKSVLKLLGSPLGQIWWATSGKQLPTAFRAEVGRLFGTPN